MDSKNIIEFKNGDKIESFFMVRSCECKVSSNGKKYLDCTLGDSSGDINAKHWEYKDGDENEYGVGNLIKVRGTVIEWQGNLQLRMDKLRLAEKEDEVDVSLYVPVAPYSGEEMYDEVINYIEKIKDVDIKDITQFIVEENKDKLLHYPAAKKNHHSVRSGLLYHMTTMLKAGDKLCEIYAFLNTDLVFSGVILHDMAKIVEMDANDLGIVNEYTVRGQLLGHIVEGIKMVDEAAEILNTDKEKVMLLQHMILSHHYEPEYGSPIKPMFPEAEMLHYLDIMDARMYDMEKALRDTKSGSFSDKIWSLDNRKVYKNLLNKN